MWRLLLFLFWDGRGAAAGKRGRERERELRERELRERVETRERGKKKSFFSRVKKKKTWTSDNYLLLPKNESSSFVGQHRETVKKDISKQ